MMVQLSQFKHRLTFLLVLLSILPAILADWDTFDECAWETLTHSLPSCAVSNSTQTIEGNRCLCPNRIFIQNVAQSLKCYCPCYVLQATADQLVLDCNKSSTPAAYDVAEIVNIGLNYESCGGSPLCSSSILTVTASGRAVATLTQGREPDPTATWTSTSAASSTVAPTASGPPGDPNKGGAGFANWKKGVLVGLFVGIPVIATTWYFGCGQRKHNKKTRELQAQTLEIQTEENGRRRDSFIRRLPGTEVSRPPLAYVRDAGNRSGERLLLGSSGETISGVDERDSRM